VAAFSGWHEINVFTSSYNEQDGPVSAAAFRRPRTIG